MKTSSLTLLVITVGFALGAAPATQPSPQQQIEDLKSKVAALEAKVKSLETQVQQRDSILARTNAHALLQLNDFSFRAPPAPPAPPQNSTPPGASPYTFNGQTIYIVPLSGNNSMSIAPSVSGVGKVTVQNANPRPKFPETLNCVGPASRVP